MIEINTSCIPHVNHIDMEYFENSILNSNCFFVAEYNKNILGVIVAFDEYRNYSSPNYEYFKNHFSNFLYIDRIATKEGYRERKIGTKLYAEVINYSKNKFKLLTCEVNKIPPNPISLLFHESIGFTRIDKCKLSNEKSVIYMKKEMQYEY